MDADSNLWIAGDHTVTKLFTDPAGISDGAAVAATPADPVLMLSTSANAPIDIHLDSTFISYHITNPAYAFSYWSPISDDDLWDTGIVISRGAQNNIYVANSGVIGKVPFISCQSALFCLFISTSTHNPPTRDCMPFAADTIMRCY